METIVLNGTNAVGMNGTSDILPVNGTNYVGMNGTSGVVPMQGSNGGYYEVHPLAYMQYEDVPLNGVPSDYDERDIDAYRVAYLSGDPDALNGLFSKLKSKIQQARAGNKDARNNRRADKAERKELRQQKKKDGTRFIDKFGGALSNVGEALKLKAQTAAALEDAGIDYDDEIIEQRSYMAADQGLTGDEVNENLPAAPDPNGGIIDKISAYWAGASTTEKTLVVVGGSIALYAIYKGVVQPMMDGKRKKRK